MPRPTVLSIALEEINGIRSPYRKSSGQRRYYRVRSNSWSFYEFDRQESYKATWEGLPVVHVNPRRRSTKCSICGDQIVFSKESRILHCPSCSYHIDREVNAARNILSAGPTFSLLELSVEAVKGESIAHRYPRRR